MNRALGLISILSLVALGCDGGMEDTDSGAAEDGGSSDAGPRDAGPIDDDGGPIEDDAGPTDVDGGPSCGNGVIDGDEDCDGDAVPSCEDELGAGATGTVSCNEDCTLDVTACALCGNDVVEAGEDCEEGMVGAATCAGEGFDGGTLGCTTSCTFDTSMCDDCGDGVRTGDEECDGTAGTTTCADEGFDGGTLGCTTSCTFDTSMCDDCGDGVRTGAEQCEGSDLNLETCGSRGFDGGDLACTSTCTYDVGACTDCGDGTVEGLEQCEGAAVTSTCADEGFDGGTLACDAATCTYDTALCHECGDGMIGGPEECDASAFGTATCGSRGFDGGDLACTASCTIDDAACTDCGDGAAEGTEMCDGADLLGATCATVPGGFMTGPLGCTSACAYDVSSCTDAPAPGGGQIVITEIMRDPSVLPDDAGEWFEVRNTSGAMVNLFGCIVTSGGTTPETFTIDTNVLVAPGALATFAEGNTTPGAPGFEPTYRWADDTLFLGNGTDFITITCGTTEIDSVAWDGTFPNPSGASIGVGAPAMADATMNDAAASWCPQRSVFGPGPTFDNGTPGAANDRCAWSVGFCRLQFPQTINQASGTTVGVFGRVYAAGLTDVNTAGNDPDVGLLLAQVGYGPDDSDPSMSAAWSWTDAAPHAAYMPGSPGFEANNDEYVADLVLPVNGTYDYAYRFSGDAGRTWLYCDGRAEGSSNGYAPVDAGQMTVAGCQLVINEFASQGPDGADDEFIEVYNGCAVSFDLNGGRIQYRSSAGTTDNNVISFTAPTVIAPGEYRLYAGPGYSLGGTVDGTFTQGLAGTSGGVGLRNAEGAVIDSVGYGTATNAYVEGTAAIAPTGTLPIARTPNGRDTNVNSADFVRAAPTPRASN